MDDPFREPGLARSTALVPLAAGAAQRRRAVLREVDDLPPGEIEARAATALAGGMRRAHTLAMASAVTTGTIMTALAMAVLALPSHAALTVLVLGLAAILVMSVPWFAMAAERRQRRRRDRLEAGLDYPRRLPFSLLGWVSWLAAERPLFDVVFAVPVDADRVEAMLQDHDRDVTADAIDARTVRVVIPPRAAVDLDGTTHLGGDAERFARLVTAALEPLHATIGIDRIEMGGAMDGPRGREAPP